MNRQKGDEVANYTDSYNSDRQITQRAVYFYGASLSRASAANSNDCTSQINTYNGTKDITSTVATDLVNIKSITYNNITNRQKGDEVANYTDSYNSDRQITQRAVYFYGALLVRASAAGSEDTTGQINTYSALKDITLATAIDVIDIKNITYNDVASRQKGEEVANYTDSYNSSSVIIQRAVYFYGSSLSRASAANSDDPTSQINTYNALKDITLATAIDTSGIKNITYNYIIGKEKGEEVANYTDSYNSSGSVTQRAVYFYGASLSRASVAGSNDPTSQINTYSGTKVIATVTAAGQVF